MIGRAPVGPVASCLPNAAAWAAAALAAFIR